MQNDEIRPHRIVRKEQPDAAYELVVNPPKDLFAPGNIVRLLEPYRPDDLNLHRVRQARREFRRSYIGNEDQPWDNWRGFTYGIIVKKRQYDHLILYLYEPTLSLLYIEPDATIPVEVDLLENQVEPYKRATTLLYRTVDQE